MAVAAQTVSGRVLKGKAGKTLRFNVAWRDPSGAIIDSSDYTAHLQIRDVKNSRQVILDVAESTTPNAALSRYNHTLPDLSTEERFLIELGKSYTSWLPEDTIFECELVSNSNPDDVAPLFTVMVKMESEWVI